MRLPPEGGKLWHNGAQVAVSGAGLPLTDPAFVSGLGLFETIALRRGRALELSRHLSRLARGALRLRVPLPSQAELTRAVGEMADAEGGAHAWLKIVATRGANCYVYTGPSDPSEAWRSVSAIVLPWQRAHTDPLVGVKSLNYASNVLGLEEARRRGADEGLWLNSRGHVAEGCTSNVFVVQHGRLFTPALRDGILPGVTREIVLRIARREQRPVHEGKLRVKRLERADELFLSSSLGRVRPVTRLDGGPVGGGSAGAVTLRIIDQLKVLEQEES